MWSFRRFSRLNIAIVALVIVSLVGIFGFMWIEDFTLLESFYMTIITISTVGFSEIRPLSDAGRLFTALLIMTSFGIFAYTIGALFSYVFNGEMRKFFKERRLKKTIGQLSNHVIICGFGRNGNRAAEEIANNDEEFVVIDNDINAVNEHGDLKNPLVIHGDARNDEILEMAQIKKAKALISTMPDDSDNLLIVLTAREMNKDLLIISRATHDTTRKKLKIAGANNVIMPDNIGGTYMGSLVVKPDVVEFFDHILQSSKAPFLKEVYCSDLYSKNETISIGELKEISKTGVSIIGVKTEDGDYIVNPDNEIILEPKSKVFILGSPEQISEV